MVGPPWCRVCDARIHTEGGVIQGLALTTHAGRRADICEDCMWRITDHGVWKRRMEVPMP